MKGIPHGPKYSTVGAAHRRHHHRHRGRFVRLDLDPLCPTEAPSLVIAAARLTLSALILAPLALTRYRHEYRRLTRRDAWLAVLSGVFLALHFATWISSLEYTTVASSTVLVSTSPLFVAIASWLFLREKIGPAVIVGLGVALAGSAVIGLSDRSGTLRNALLGDVLAFAGAITVAGYLLIGRRLRAKLSLIPYIAVVYGTAAVVMLAMVLVTRERVVGYSPDHLLVVPAARARAAIAGALGVQLGIGASARHVCRRRHAGRTHWLDHPRLHHLG